MKYFAELVVLDGDIPLTLSSKKIWKKSSRNAKDAKKSILIVVAWLEFGTVKQSLRGLVGDGH